MPTIVHTIPFLARFLHVDTPSCRDEGRIITFSVNQTRVPRPRRYKSCRTREVGRTG